VFQNFCCHFQASMHKSRSDQHRKPENDEQFDPFTHPNKV
jgi:hypothetical protein